MGRSFVLAALIAACALFYQSNSCAQSLQADLEARKFLSARQGQAISVLALGAFDAEEYAKAVSKDFTALSKLLPNVASIRLLKSDDKKTLLVVKVKGLSLSSSLVFEVREIKLAPAGYLSTHTPTALEEIPLSVDAFQKNGMQTVSPVLASVFENELSANKSDNKPAFKEKARIELVGPLNQLQVYPGLEMSARLSIYEYKSKTSTDTGALSLDLGFYQGRRAENLGDIKGFGAAGMRIAESFTGNYISSLRAEMQKFDPSSVVTPKKEEGDK